MAQTTNAAFIKANFAAFKTFLRSQDNIDQMIAFGPHDAYIDIALYQEAHDKGIILDDTLPAQTMRGNTGPGRVSTARTLASRELIAKHGDGAVKWTGSNWNSRLIRSDLVEEYRRLIKPHLGL